MKENGVANMSTSTNNVGATNIEQDTRNQKVLQNRLQKELARQRIRLLQKEKEKQLFSQAAIPDLPSESSLGLKTTPTFIPPSNETQSVPQTSNTRRPYRNDGLATNEVLKQSSITSYGFSPPDEVGDGSGPRKNKNEPYTRDFDYYESDDFIQQMVDHKNFARLSGKPLALYRGNPEVFDYNHDKQTTNKSKFTEDDTVLDIIRTGRDESKYVTIIPADESKTIDLEFQDWKRHRRTFVGLVGFALVLIIVINVLTVYSARTFYLKTTHRFAFLQFVIHADIGIVGTVFLSSLGLVIFRLFPNYNGNTIIKIHISIFVLVTGLFIYGGLIISSKYHELVTGVNEHVYTLHAWTGVLVACLGSFTIATGIYVTIRRKKFGAMTKYHSSSGMMTFVFCGSSCVSGFLVRAILFNGKSYTTFDSKTTMNNTTGLLIVIFCLLIRYICSDFRFRRRAKPEWDTMFARKISPYERSSIDYPGTLEQYVTRITTMADF